MPAPAGRTPVPPHDGGGMPKLLRFLGLHLALGMAIGMGFAAVTIMTNTAGLKTLLEASDQPYLAMFLLYFMLALTFGSLAMGIGVMNMPLEKPTPGDHHDTDPGTRRP